MTPNERGFDRYYGYLASGAQDYYTHRDGKYLDFFLNNNARHNVVGTYSTILYNNRATAYINEYVNRSQNAADKPLFLYAAYQTVHDPLEAPPDVNTSKSKYIPCENVTDADRKTYCQKLVSVDTIIGNLIDGLKENNLWNDTVVIFTTDNGGLPFYDNSDGKHNGYGLNLPYRAGKDTLFEGGVHGNGFISGGNYEILPEELRGKNNSVLCHAIDWLPTIIEGILGITIDDEDKQFITGQNIWNDIVGGGTKVSNRSIYLELFYTGAVAPQHGVIYNGYKYINGTQPWTLYYPTPPQLPFGNESQVNDTVFLFDLNNDPYERNNIAMENKDLCVSMQAMIENAKEEMGYMDMQDGTKQAAGNPELFNNTYQPWIGNKSHDY